VQESGTAYRLLVGKSEGKSSLGRPQPRCLNDIKMDLGWDSVDWIGLAHDRDKRRALVNVAINFRVL
jgi:hypothetical protein